MTVRDGEEVDAAIDRMSDRVDPEEVENLLQPFTRDGFEVGNDVCPECGGDNVEEFDIELEAMLDADEAYGPQPARVVCHDCETVLYEHPKWRVLQVCGDDYAYTEV